MNGSVFARLHGRGHQGFRGPAARGGGARGRKLFAGRAHAPAMDAPPAPQPGGFRWACGLSDAPDLERAVGDACASVEQALGGARTDLAVLFVSAGFADRYDEAARLVHGRLQPRAMVGTTGMGVIGVGREVEERPAVSVSAGALPGVSLAPFRVDARKVEELDVSPANWSAFLGTPLRDDVHFLLFAHPFTAPTDDLVAALDQAYPTGRKVGGLASGGNTPETMALFLGEDTYYDGAVGCAIWGDVAFDVIVAQGCRPVGPQLKVTKAAGTHLFELDGERALDRVMAVLNAIPEDERILARRTVFVGVAMEAHEKEGGGPYDGGYLVRNIMGGDRETGALHVGHQLREGQTVRLQVRDARTADQELVEMLRRYGEARGEGAPPAAAFMFQCNGRGTNLFGREGHDAQAFERALGRLPLAGFFCNGEIGPVGEVTYLHGYTSSIGILRAKGPGRSG